MCAKPPVALARPLIGHARQERADRRHACARAAVTSTQTKAVRFLGGNERTAFEDQSDEATHRATERIDGHHRRHSEKHQQRSIETMTTSAARQDRKHATPDTAIKTQRVRDFTSWKLNIIDAMSADPHLNKYNAFKVAV